MGDYIIVGILLEIIVIAIFRTKKHFKGGSGNNTIRDKKTLTEPKIGEKILTIEGIR